MRSHVLTATAVSLMMTVTPVMARDTQQAKPVDPQVMMETYQKLAIPGEPHKQLARLAGTWTTKTKEWMEPNKPPMESTGTAEYKVLLDGRYVQSEYDGQMMGQPYHGIGLHAYDNMEKKYVTTWIDSMGTGIFVMRGTASADGKTITLHGSHPDPFQGEMKHRAVWKLVDENTQIFEMYGNHENHDMKMLEITYTRKP